MPIARRVSEIPYDEDETEEGDVSNEANCVDWNGHSGFGQRCGLACIGNQQAEMTAHITTRREKE